MKKATILLIALMVISVGFLSGCEEQKDDTTEGIDTDGDGYNDDVDAFPDDPNEWKDSDKDGVGDNADEFKYDPTQWTDRDGDGYGDNPNGNNPDLFPNDSTEWKDSDSDQIGDNADIYDSGNGGIRIHITEFHCDDWTDELFSQPDPYFWVYVYAIPEDGEPDYFSKKSAIYDNMIDIYSSPIYWTIDVDDDIERVSVQIDANDDDVDADDIIDLAGESTIAGGVIVNFYPRSNSQTSYSSDGRLDLVDELDGWMDFKIEVVGV